MEVLGIFGLWEQETDSWFTNHEALIPTLYQLTQSISYGFSYIQDRVLNETEGEGRCNKN